MPVHIFWISWVLMRITLFCVALIFVQCNANETGSTSNRQIASETDSTSKPQTGIMTGGLIAQNNQVTRANAERLTGGMTPSQVKSIMGTPHTETKGSISNIIFVEGEKTSLTGPFFTLTFCNGNKSVGVSTSFDASDRLQTISISETTIGIAHHCLIPAR